MGNETEIKLRLRDVKGLQRKLKRLGAKLVSAGSGRVHEMNMLFDSEDGRLAKHGQLLRIRTETQEPGKKARAGKLSQRVLLTFKRPPEGELELVGSEEAAGAGQLSSSAQREAETARLSVSVGQDAGTSDLSATARLRRRPLQSHGRYKVREEIELVVADSGAMGKIFEGLGLHGWFRYEKYRTTYELPARQKWAKGLLIEIDEVPIGTFVELEGPGEAIDRAAKELGFTRKDYITKNYLALYVEECRAKGEQPGDMLFTVKRTGKRR